jgi:hypothetical protein
VLESQRSDAGIVPQWRARRASVDAPVVDDDQLPGDSVRIEGGCDLNAQPHEIGRLVTRGTTLNTMRASVGRQSKLTETMTTWGSYHAQ